MSLSVSMSGLGVGEGAKGWSHWRELPAGGIRASQGTFSSVKIKCLNQIMTVLLEFQTAA